MTNLKLLRCPNCRKSCVNTNDNLDEKKSIKIGTKCKNIMNEDWECCICMNYENETNNSIIKLNECVCKGNNQYVHEECIMSFFKILTQNIGNITFDLDDEDELYEYILNELTNFKKILENYKKKKACDKLLELTLVKTELRHRYNSIPSSPSNIYYHWEQDSSSDEGEYFCSQCGKEAVYCAKYSSILVQKMKSSKYTESDYSFGKIHRPRYNLSGKIVTVKQIKEQDGELAYQRILCDDINCRWNFLMKFKQKSIFQNPEISYYIGSLIKSLNEH